MKHTPGPWVFGLFGRLLAVPIVDGMLNKYEPICDLGEQHFPSKTEVYANAQLISAAPDMLEVLDRFVNHRESIGEDDYQRARAALTKALGAE